MPGKKPARMTAGRYRDGSENAAIDTMLQHRVDGMMLISPRLSSTHITAVSRQAPLVVIGRGQEV